MRVAVGVYAIAPSWRCLLEEMFLTCPHRPPMTFAGTQPDYDEWGMP